MVDVLLHLNQKLMDAYGEIEVSLTSDHEKSRLVLKRYSLKRLPQNLSNWAILCLGESMGFADSTSSKEKSFVSSLMGEMNA